MSDAVKFPNVVAVLKKLSPVSLAESWDNVGLLMEPDGRKSDTVDCVFFTNDLTEDVLKEAQLVRADLIVSYHPPIFTSFKRITLDSWKSRIVSRCLSQGIAVYSPHTSWDVVENGLTDWLISCFDGKVSPIQPLITKPEFSHVVTISSSANNDSESSMFDGKLITEILKKQSDFKTDIHFKVLNHNDRQIQLLCDSSDLQSLNEIAKSHGKYVHVNKNEPMPSNTTAGNGRRCQFNDGLTISDAVAKIKKHLGVDNLMVALARGSTLDSIINSAAAVAGSGATLLRGVKADLYLTGEMSHHDVLDAIHDNVTVVLANHSNTERGYLKVFAEKLLAEIPNLSKIHISKVDKDPLIFV